MSWTHPDRIILTTDTFTTVGLELTYPCLYLSALEAFQAHRARKHVRLYTSDLQVWSRPLFGSRLVPPVSTNTRALHSKRDQTGARSRRKMRYAFPASLIWRIKLKFLTRSRNLQVRLERPLRLECEIDASGTDNVTLSFLRLCYSEGSHDFSGFLEACSPHGILGVPAWLVLS